MAVQLSISNPHPRKLPGPELLHELVPREGRDGAAAIEYAAADGSRRVLQYDQLHAKASTLAARIQSAMQRAPTEPNRLILPILVPQCPELYISQLASLKAGGAFCPIVLDVPEERLRFILQDIDARVLLTTTAFKTHLPDLGDIEIIEVDDEDCTQETIESFTSVSPKDPAYVMYTSGSTGQPKGVLLSHSAATQALLAHDRHIPHFTRFLQFASPTFDVSVFEIFFPWFRQRTLIACERRRTLNDLPAVINDLDVDACELTPSVAASLLRRRDLVPGLKALLTIGEMLKPAVVEEFGGNNKDDSILHGMYGPTEATIHCTLQTHFPKSSPCGSIGVPLDTVSTFVGSVVNGEDGNPNMEIAPVGEEGELIVGGYQLADGYLNREEQTRAAFIQHPQYGMLYRTGDRAMMLPDGSFQCLGRISNGQVKLRGQRIELGEIEHAAAKTSGVRDVAAEVIDNALIIFCATDDHLVTADLILESCRKWLPTFMVPGHAVVFNSLPYLASGKCDRKTLRLQYQSSQTMPESAMNDVDAETQRVMETVSTVLRTDVKPDTPLLSAGLDSLSSIRLASELRKAGFGQLDAGRLLGCRTVVDVARILENLEHGRTAPDSGDTSADEYRQSLDADLSQYLPPTALQGVESSFPCTPVQASMLAETSKDARAYCNWAEFELRVQHTLDALVDIIRQLARLHPLLRSGFMPVTRLPCSYAILQWKELEQSQIQEVPTFAYDFQLSDEKELRHPAQFQIRRIEKHFRVLLKAHHALFDQWSLDLIRTDLAALLRDRNCRIPGAFKSVSDYHYRHIEEARSAEAIEFWQGELREAVPTTLPLLRGDVVPDALQRTEWHDLALGSTDLGTQLQGMSCSRPAFFQTIVAFLLSRYSGASDVILGSVFSGRTIPVAGIDSTFGPCLTTLPLRVDFRSANTCKDLLLSVTQQNRAIQQHSLTPLTMIREAAGVAPGVALFDTLFVWQESTLDMDDADGVVELVDSRDQLEFSLVLEFEPSPTVVKVRATYQQNMITSEQAGIILSQIDVLASELLSKPDTQVDRLGCDLPLELLSISNPQPIDYGRSFDLTKMIERRAVTQPNAHAIIFAGNLEPQSSAEKSMTYAELDARANRVAHLLIAMGIQPEDLICICMEKCIDLYVAMLAVFKAGGGYLPLVPETPPERVKSVLSQAHIGLCICDLETTKVFQGLTDAMVIDCANWNLSNYPDSRPDVPQVDSRVAYAVFTSGSTGAPKGVAVTMANLKGNVAVLDELYRPQPGDRLLQSCSQAFDVSVFEIFFSLYTGMTLCSATKDVIFRDFEGSVRSFKATHLSLTPTVAALVTPGNVPSVKFLVTAGEGITERVHRVWAGHGLHQGYGPSETTNICSVKMNVTHNDVLGNIGPPFQNTSAFVLGPDSTFDVLPAGAYGEFAFGGEQVFRGYIGRDDLNSEKIIDHPVYGRVYRSGDMGRILANGTLLITGRIDDQVKIRGNRVELGEINAVAASHPTVADCTTLVIGEKSSQQMLAIFWVPSAQMPEIPQPEVMETAADQIPSIYAHLEATLPPYMIPSALCPVTKLPVTSQGKLDKRFLRALLQDLDKATRDKISRVEPSTSGDAPSSPLEATVAEALLELLDLPPQTVSRHSSFFALGLNSLNAIRLSKLLEGKVSTRVSISTIMRNASVIRLAKVLSMDSELDKPSENDGSVDNLLPSDLLEMVMTSLEDFGDLEAILPCTPLQQAMLSMVGGQEKSAYCTTIKISFPGDMERLRDCWREITIRHGILRTSFVETSHAAHPFVQVVAKVPASSWHDDISKPSQSANGHASGHSNSHDKGHTNGKANGHSSGHVNGHSNGHVNAHLNGHSGGYSNGRANGRATAKVKLTPVTLRHPVRIDVRSAEIYLQMHHAIYDGIAVSNLFAELRSLYDGGRLPPPILFKPFLHGMLAQNGKEAINFWSECMRDFMPQPFPLREDADSHHERTLHVALSLDQRELNAFSERYSCTSLSIFQAAWVKTLACLQDASDLCFGNVVSGRSLPVTGIERLIAPCFNTIPVRARLDAVHSNLQLIRQMHRYNLDTLPFQLTGPRQIQPLSKDPSQHLFQSLLLVQALQVTDELDAEEEGDMSMGIPIVVEIKPDDGLHHLELHYMCEFVHDDSAGLIAEAFVASLRSCLRYPTSAIDHFLKFDRSLVASKMKSLSPAPTQADGALISPDLLSDLWDAKQMKIRNIFAELAQIDPDRISKQTSLYQIGLDSLNAVQVAAQMRKQGLKADAADVMQYQTPAALANYLQSNGGSESQPSPSTSVDLQAFESSHRQHIVQELHISADSLEAVRPALPSQSGMLAQFIQSGGTRYLSHNVYAVPEAYSTEVVQAAWATVQRKQQTLRMGFCQVQDALTSFAMLIYRPDASIDCVFSPCDDSEPNQVLGRAATSILDNLHSPLWRVSIAVSSSGRQMHLSLHHALYDANSLRILLADFAGALRGSELDPPFSIDSILTDQLDGATVNKKQSEVFWTKASESARVGKFPNLSSTITSTTSIGSLETTAKLDVSAIDKFCRTEGCTVQALGQTAWALLLAAYLGEPDVTFGTVFAGTSSNGLRHVAFPAISTVPVFCNTAQSTPKVLKEMVSYNASAQKHRFTPLSDIQRCASSPGQTLFDTMFVYQKTATRGEDDFDWRLIEDSLDIDYAASLEMEISSLVEIRLRLTYGTKSIPDAHALLMVKQYDAILEGIVRGESTSTSIELMSYSPPKEPTLPCSVGLLHQFVERGALHHPESPALEFVRDLGGSAKSRQRWTYEQLNARSNQVAHMIHERGVEPGNVVGVCMNKCAEASFAFIGILKAGCAFLAMDPELPIARRKFIIEDSRSQLLFVDSATYDAEMKDVVTMIEMTEDVLLELPDRNLDIPPVEPDSTSYCLYTSGTTGTPKGCELTHENAVQAMMAFQRLFRGHWDDDSRWLQFASYWFDVSVLEQFWSWSVGIAVVTAPRDLVLEDLAGFIRQANITHIDLTPSLARLLTPQEVPSLWNHVFITGGEALKQEIIDAWGPYKTICNGYGPTEATIGVTMNPFIGTDAKPSNIGPAFDNVGAYVFVPGTDQLVMRGAVGELCVSGKLVGKGYLNRPELMAKSFPYIESYGERVYRTGDLVRLLADGSVSFIGRADTQAKLRGQRLEIDEIDSVIKSSAETISDITSLVVKSSEGNREMLVSFIVDGDFRSRDLSVAKSNTSERLVQAAEEACRGHLPGYMVPTHIIPISRLPLTVNNKVDTKKLLSLFDSLSLSDLQQLKSCSSSTRGMTVAERKIAQTLARSLSIEVVGMGPHSNIFSLGLSSISAINFATMLRRTGFSSSSVIKVMNNPTIVQLASALSGDENNTGQEESDSSRQAQLAMAAFAQRYRSTVAQYVDPSTIEDVVPCTPLQQGLLTASLKSDRSPYFNHFWYDVSFLDQQKLETAVRQLFKIVPILRTLFLQVDEGFCQVVTRKIKCRLQVIAVDSENIEQHALQRKQTWISASNSDIITPFEVLILCSRGRTVMAMHAHHALYDGISWDLTMQHLTQLFLKGTTDCGPSFVDALPHGPLCKRANAEEFWAARLKDNSYSPLTARPDLQGSKHEVAVQVSFPVSSSLEQARRSLGLSHQTVFQAAFAVALHQLSPKTTSYGVIFSGRSIAFDKADQVVGPMFNTLPFTVDLREGDKWSQVLQRCQQSNVETLPFQHTPLRDIRKFSGKSPADPIFDVLFAFQQSSRTTQDDLFRTLEVQIPTDYSLAFEVELVGHDTVSVTAASAEGHLSDDAARSLIGSFAAALDYIVRDPESKVSDEFNVQVRHEASIQLPPQQTSHSDDVSTFTWTAEALLLRNKIAETAQCSPDAVTEHTAIFTIGLDSIDAVKLVSRLRRSGLSLQVSAILQAQTIPRMVEALQKSNLKTSSVATTKRLPALEAQLQKLLSASELPLEEEYIERILPATPGQEALLAEMIRSDFAQYYNFDVLRLRSDIELSRLKAAWQSVVDASPILRTSFVEISDAEIDVAFAQAVHRPRALIFDEISFITLEDIPGKIEKIRKEMTNNIASKPPLRLVFADDGDGQHYLILSLAHAQYDGHSLALIHQDVRSAYHDNLQGRPLYDEAIEIALEATAEKSLDFWRNALAGAQVTRFTKREQSHDSVAHRAEHTSTISVRKVQVFCRRLGISLQAFAQTAWALLLSSYIQHLEVVFGVVLACRETEDLQATMFPTMNTVPVRVAIHGSGEEMLRHVQSIINDMRSYKATPLRYVQTACANTVQYPPGSNKKDLFDTLFIYQHSGDADKETSSALYTSVDGDSNIEYPVAVETEVADDKMILRTACKSHIFTKANTGALLLDFDKILIRLMDMPSASTVRFSEDAVSVCGLPAFAVVEGQLSRHPTRTEVPDNFDDVTEEESDLVASIRSALARVAKVNEKEVSPHSSIQSIGIDSISAIKVAALLRKESLKLSVSDILKAQTPRRMAELVDCKASATPREPATDIITMALRDVDVPDIVRRSGIDMAHVEKVLPATAGQQYMLSMWYRTDGELFFPKFSYHISTNKSREEISGAWQSVLEDNSVLRTVFCATSHPTKPILQVVLKAEHVPKQGTSSALESQPMHRLALEKTDGGYDLQLKIHHALYDAVSLPLLISDLQAALNKCQLTNPRTTLQDYVALSLQESVRAKQRSFWTQYLHDIKPMHLALPHPSGLKKKVQIFKPAAFSPASKIETIAKANQITTQALLFAMYAKVYAGHATESADTGNVVFGVYLANRSHLSDLDQVGAPTLNLLPLLVRSPQQASLLSVAREIDADLRQIGSAENSATSLADIFAWTGVKVDSFLNFLKLPERSEESPSSKGGNQIQLTDGEWEAERSRVYESERPERFKLPKELDCFNVGEAYQHALDVELSLANDTLSIGFFCVEGMLGLQESEAFVSEMTRELTEMLQ